MDIKDTTETVAKLPECTGKVGVMGYCIGGLMTFLTTVRYSVDAAVAALAGKPNVTLYSYPGQWHAFTRINGVHYNAEAAGLANARTNEFLNQQLR